MQIAHQGLLRSLDRYNGDPERVEPLKALYGRLVRPGDVVFDIGAHVGERTHILREMGCFVVAVEPNPEIARHLRRYYTGDRHVVVEELAVAERIDAVDLYVNSEHPSLTSTCPEYVERATEAGWGRWDKTLRVHAVTLDWLADRHGMPSFVKLDIEGHEFEALKGMSFRPALSFEYTSVLRESAQACLRRLGSRYVYNRTESEDHELVYERWHSEVRMQNDLLFNSRIWGDLYARPL